MSKAFFTVISSNTKSLKPGQYQIQSNKNSLTFYDDKGENVFTLNHSFTEFYFNFIEITGFEATEENNKFQAVSILIAPN